jgi:hypothetical protein
MGRSGMALGLAAPMAVPSTLRAQASVVDRADLEGLAEATVELGSRLTGARR